MKLTTTRKYTHLTACLLILWGFFLRVSQLNNIAIEKAEMLTINWFIRPGLSTLLTHNKDLNNHPLNSLLGYLTSLGNETLFTLRWHSVLIGVISIAAVIRLASMWFGRRDALIAGLLISVSAYHVALSQQARGYVGLIGFTLLGFYFAYQALQSKRKIWWLGFIIFSILNIYAHLYGIMAVGVTGVIIFGLILAQRVTAAKSLWRSLSPLLISGLIIYVIGFSLYLPMLSDTLATAGQANRYRDSDSRNAAAVSALELVSAPLLETFRPFSLARDSTRLHVGDPSFNYGPLGAIAALSDGSPGFYLALLSYVMGVIFSWKPYRKATLVCLAWLILPFVIQFIGYFILPGAYFRGRFLAFLYIPYLLLMARGWPGLSDWLLARAKKKSPGVQRLAQSVGWAGVLVLAALNLAWLGVFHSAAKQEHWPDVAAAINAQLQPGDYVYCGQRSNTACSFDVTVRLRQEVKELDDDFISLEQLQRNPAYFKGPGRVWMVMPRLTRPQIAALEAQIKPSNFRLFGSPKYDQTGLILLESQAAVGHNLADALQLGVNVSLNPAEALINAVSLIQLNLADDQLPAAEQNFAVAAAALPGYEDAWQGNKFESVARQLEYARLAAQTAETLPAGAVRVGRNLGGFAKLLAYQLDRDTIAPGEALQVQLYWQPTAPIADEFISYVYLTDLNANPLVKAEGIPAAGKAPTSSWEAGALIVDSYTLTLDENVSAPLALNLEAGLFKPENFQFVSHLDERGQKIYPGIAKLKALPPVAPTIAPENIAAANFGDKISLLGYDYSPNSANLTLYWQAQEAMAEDYTVFIHFIDQAGQLAGQVDGQPYYGNYPTSWWSSGEAIVDRRPLPELAPGAYTLVAGWYRPADGVRLPVENSPEDSATLGVINIPGSG